MVKNRFNTLAKQKREEKRNISTKPLEEVIISLEDSKDRRDLDNWVDEKIEELQRLISKEESSGSKSDLESKYAAMSLQDRRKRKYEEKKEFYENWKMEVDREDISLDKNQRNSQHPQKDSNVGHTHTFNSVNFETKQNIFDLKEDSGMLWDSTPQQYFNKRTPMEGQLGVFASPLEVPKRSLQQRETRGNNSFSVMKPIPSPSIPKNFEQNKIHDKVCSVQSDETLMSLLKIWETKESKSSHLKLIKQLLCEFRDSDEARKSKTLSTIDNMIQRFDWDSNMNLVSTHIVVQLTLIVYFQLLVSKFLYVTNCFKIQQAKSETKMSSSTSSVVSFENKQNFLKENDQKQAKTAFGSNKSNKVK